MEDREHRFKAFGVVCALVPVTVRVHVSHEYYGAVRVVGIRSEVEGQVFHHQSLGVGNLIAGRVRHRVTSLPPRFGDPASVFARPPAQLVCIRCAAGARAVGADRHIRLGH